MKKQEENSSHWSKQKEKATGFHIKLLFILFRLFPVIILRIIAFPVGFFYFLFSKKARAESARFLQKAAPFVTRQDVAKKCRSPFGPLRHIVSFSLALVEKLQAWGGKFKFDKIHFQNDDVDELINNLENGQGVFLITSHIGNIELLRGLASFNRTGISRKTPVTAVIDMKVSEKFTRMLKELNPQSSFDIINADEISLHTAAVLDYKLSEGEMVTIAGDRTAASSTGRGARSSGARSSGARSSGARSDVFSAVANSIAYSNGVKRQGNNLMIPFLGEEAPFSLGIFYLAALLKAPIYFVFAIRRGDLSILPEYDMYVHKNRLSLECSRKERYNLSSLLARSFANLLESYCKQNPFQWYNFYNFWEKEAG